MCSSPVAALINHVLSVVSLREVDAPRTQTKAVAPVLKLMGVYELLQHLLLRTPMSVFSSVCGQKLSSQTAYGAGDAVDAASNDQK
jgi:hypothetical protein